MKIVSWIVVVLMAGLSACARDSQEAQQTAPTPKATAYAPKIDPAKFSTEIDNPYFPLVPGTKRTYEAKVEDGTERTVVEVTDETLTVKMGVEALVVRDTVSLNGSVIEDTRDWFAQDDEGNVWYFGEDTAEYEDGKIVNHEGAWEAGVDGAQPGIVMKADPKVGDVYRQEYYKGEAEDMGEVIALGKSEEVPAGKFDDLIVTKDWSPLEPDAEENKYYAKGIGPIIEVHTKGSKERAELIKFEKP